MAAVVDLKSGALNTLQGLRDRCELVWFAISSAWESKLGSDTLHEMNPDWASEDVFGPNVKEIFQMYRQSRGLLATSFEAIRDARAEYIQPLDWPQEDALEASTLISNLLHMGGDVDCLTSEARGGVGRAFFITQDGSIGKGPLLAQPNDIVVILFGGKTPYVLRPTDVDGEYLFVGECYIHGIMYGEHIEKLKAEGKFEEAKTLFTLV